MAREADQPSLTTRVGQERLHVTTKRFYRRRFLNRRGFHAGAYVLANCEVDAFRPKDGPARYTIDADFTIADCSRIATLDFCVSDEPSAQNALQKARQLRDVMVELPAALETAIEDWRDLHA